MEDNKEENKMFWFPTSKRLAVTFILQYLVNVKLSYVSRVHLKVHNLTQCIDCNASLYLTHLRSNLSRQLFFVAVYCSNL